MVKRRDGEKYFGREEVLGIPGSGFIKQDPSITLTYPKPNRAHIHIVFIGKGINGEESVYHSYSDNYGSTWKHA